jgi:diaminopimelate decarboxylase
VGNAGILLTEVLYLKETDEKKFVIVDGGMNDLIRPALYGSYQAIQPVEQNNGEKIVADIVGPICESGDFFAKDREIARPDRGDLLAVMSAGAHGLPWHRTIIPIRSRQRFWWTRTVLCDRVRESLDDLDQGETHTSVLQ